MNKVIRLACTNNNYFMLLRLSCCLNKVKIRFYGTVFVRLKEILTTCCCLNKVRIRFYETAFVRLKEILTTLFIPYFINKTTLVAGNYINIPKTLLPYFQNRIL